MFFSFWVFLTFSKKSTFLHGVWFFFSSVFFSYWFVFVHCVGEAIVREQW
jgi:hypothetical protein